jgi:hypothetical protein
MTILRVDTISGIGSDGVVLGGDLEFTSQNYVILPKGTSAQEGVLRTTADVVGTGGTYYDNLVLAMPFNAATGFADVSSRNRNPGVYGNTTISTAQSKYYGSSAYFDGSGDYLSIDVGISTSTSDFVLGPSGSDFTIELYLYATSSANGGIISNYSDWNNYAIGYKNKWAFVIQQVNKIIWLNSEGGIAIEDTISLNQWVHYAICRSGSTITMYRNGTSIGTQSTPQNYTATTPLVTGYINGYGYYQGYLQDLRIYKGVAKYTANFTPPERIAEIGVGFKAGQLRYNTDSNKVELYDGNQWAEVQSSSPNLNGGARGVFGGGFSAPANLNTIDYITISSTGNAVDFGDLTQTRFVPAACSSSTRGVFGGGYIPTIVNTIDYITISSTGNAIDFGDLTQARLGLAACSSSTRGVFGGGYTPTYVNTIDYITISSTGNAVDFGDLTVSRYYSAGCSSSTRGVFGGGLTPANLNTIDFITISSTGNAQDFGDLTVARNNNGACSSSTRGVFGGGGISPTYLNVIEYITISSTGNAIDFGDLTQTRGYLAACSSSTRGVFGGGFAPGAVNTIDFITISTQSNAVDFGDLSQTRYGLASCSNAHGGL